MDVQKYSLVNELNKKDETHTGSPSLRGMSGMTFPKYINAMRTNMNTSQQKQFLNLTNAEHPFIFTSMENVAGKYSSGYKKTKSDLIVFKKIVKFEDCLKNPSIYTLFLYDREKDKFSVITRTPVQNLTENFGFEYDNEVIDSYEEDDVIKKDTVLFKSKSYDDDMNYGYGLNIPMMYTLDPYTAEDAAIVSESLDKRMTSIESDTVTIGLNSNDYLLNLYGGKKSYKVLPDIGETIENGILCGLRRQYNSQLLYDFTEKSLREIHTGDDVKLVDVGTEILDYNIYSNNEEIKRTSFNNQLFDLLESQNKYYKAIHDTCDFIMNSGSKFTRDIRYLYKRSAEFLDTQKRWKEGDAAFSNMVIEVSVTKRRGLALGQKMAGRYGNKSVISKIVPDELMPITEDGRRVHLMFNLLGIINRTTSFPLYEVFINFASYKLRKRMVKMSFEEREKELFDYLDIWNHEYCVKMRNIYDDYNKREKEEFLEDAIHDGIYIHIDDVNEDIPIFYKVQKILDLYGDTWLKPDTLYIKNPYNGRTEKIVNAAYVGEQYCIKLKQSDKRGASIRNTGAVDITSLPTKNNKAKTHLERTSSKAIRFGEFETLNLSIGIKPKDIVLFHGVYRTSPKGRKDYVNLMFDNNVNKIQKLPDTLKSQVGEIFSVFCKSLGFKITYIDNKDIIRPYDEETSLWTIDDETFVCNEYQAIVIDLAKKYEKEIIDDIAFLPLEIVCRQVNDMLIRDGYIEKGQTIYDDCGNIDIERITF